MDEEGGYESDTLEHARAGYENAQEVIQFMDTKAGAIIGMGTILVGVPIFVTQSMAGAEDTALLSFPHLMQNAPLFCDAALVSSGIGVLTGTAALIRCLHGLNARGASDTSKISILFPGFPPHKRGDAIESFKRLRRTLTTEEIAIDYEEQLLQIGAILSEKIKCVRSAVRLIEIQFAAYISALFFVVAAAMS